MADNVTVKFDSTKLDEIAQRLGTDTDGVVAALAFQVEGDAKQSLGSGPDGRSYTRRGVTHIASSPGYPPNIDTGALINSIHSWRIQENQYAVGDGVEYGAALEYGVMPKLARRPWLYPAFFKMVQTVSGKFTGLFR